MASKTVRVYEVLFDGPADGPPGPAGDGTFTQRFRKDQEEAAKAFAKANTYYGKPAKVSPTDAPRRVAQRWGMC